MGLIGGDPWVSTSIRRPRTHHQETFRAQCKLWKKSNHSYFFGYPQKLPNMKLEALSQALCLLAVFLPLASGAPARRDSNPPLRATESLVGYSPSENVATGSKPDIKYSLLPGQKENADVGAYLDFENVANPQPIRGSVGGDDPGPRKFASIFPEGYLLI